MNNSRTPWRGRIVALLAGLITTALVVTGAVQTNAAPLPHQSSATTAAAASGPVLKSKFGKATSRVQGSFGKAGTVTGSFTPRSFRATPRGDLKAVGRLTATLTRANGKVIGTTSQRVVLPVRKAEGQPLRAAAPGDCDVLNLVLGPLDLDLLGLQVSLNRVVLNIVAAPGPGNLLGNLLCAVVGLLDAGGVLTQVSQILNSILGILRL